MYIDRLGTFPDKTDEQISLLKYTKTSCGVDFMLNTGTSAEKRGWFDTDLRYKTDFFEFYFFRKASGYMYLNGQRIDLHDGMVLIICPYQQQEWHVDIDRLDYTFLVFQEEFINNFLSDKYFMYRLHYCYQTDNPSSFMLGSYDVTLLLDLLSRMHTELHHPVSDSYQMIVAYLYQFLLQLNRDYIRTFHLPDVPPLNNYAYQYKQLMEQHICASTRVDDYASEMGISRVTLNKSVQDVFGVTASHLLKARLLQEVKNDLLFTDLGVKELLTLL